MRKDEHKHYAEYHDVRSDGRIVLYKRRDASKPNYTARIKIPHQRGYIVKSTRTSDYHDARRYAEDLYYEIEGKSRRGETIRNHAFSQVAKQWVQSLPFLWKEKSAHYIKDNISIAERNLIPFFGSTPISSVADHIHEYYVHRLSERNLRNATLRHEAVALNNILKFAHSKKYINQVPTIPRPKISISPRPDIPRKEWRKIYLYLRKYVAAAKDKRQLRSRTYLQNWMLILANTGLRVGELRNVRWNDISKVKTIDGAERIAIEVSGKTGKRSAIANAGAERYFERIWKFRKKECGKDPGLNEFVFCHVDGKPILSFKKGFQRVLDEAGVLYDDNRQKRVPYSLRHTYATMRISEGVNVYQLASQMGTSVEMIETYYGKKRNRDPLNVTEITKTSRRKKKLQKGRGVRGRRTKEKASLPWE